MSLCYAQIIAKFRIQSITAFCGLFYKPCNNVLLYSIPLRAFLIEMPRQSQTAYKLVKFLNYSSFVLHGGVCSPPPYSLTAVGVNIIFYRTDDYRRAHSRRDSGIQQNLWNGYSNKTIRRW